MTGKICDKCHKPYYRVNKVHVWTVRNPGHRTGWQKQEIKTCMKCLNEGQARRTVMMVGVRIVPVNRRKVS